MSNLVKRYIPLFAALGIALGGCAASGPIQPGDDYTDDPRPRPGYVISPITGNEISEALACSLATAAWSSAQLAMERYGSDNLKAWVPLIKPWLVVAGTAYCPTLVIPDEVKETIE